jgi:hypothetical protein
MKFVIYRTFPISRNLQTQGPCNLVAPEAKHLKTHKIMCSVPLHLFHGKKRSKIIAWQCHIRASDGRYVSFTVLTSCSDEGAEYVPLVCSDELLSLRFIFSVYDGGKTFLWNTGINAANLHSMLRSTFWDIIPRSPLKVNQSFGGMCRLELHLLQTREPKRLHHTLCSQHCGWKVLGL